MAEWRFPSVSEVYDLKGLNEPGAETFKDNCIKGLAREICQNSLDARSPNVPNDQPVIVEFHRFKTGQDAFPGKEEMIEVLNNAKAFWEKRSNKKTTKFFQDALDEMSQSEYCWMRISDFNTCGLIGTKAEIDDSTPWNNLVLSSGVSEKEGDEGGSFGIGKFATFPCSSLRTCFYATKTIKDENGSEEEAFEGVARLVSYRNQSGGVTLGNGYYVQDCAPLEVIPSVDESFVRTVPGTDIYIPLFISDEDWLEDMRDSVLDGFLYAILNGKLEVRLWDDNQKIIINQNWLKDWCLSEDVKVNKSIRQDYLALTRDDATVATKEFGDDGRIELRIICGSQFDKKISMIRQTGMKIYARAFSKTMISFAGVLVAFGNGLNRRLKAFENPQHSNWQKKRNPADKGLLVEIEEFCKHELQKLFEADSGQEEDGGLGDILPATEGDGEKKEREALVPKIKALGRSKPVKKRPVTKPDTPEPGEDGVGASPEEDEGETGSGGGPGETPNDTKSGAHHGGMGEGEGAGTSGEGEARKYKTIEIATETWRSICSTGPTGEYLIIIVPKKSCKDGFITINAVAELNFYAAEIIQATLADGTPLTIENGNRITGVSFKKGERLDVKVLFAYSEYVSLDIELGGKVWNS